MTGLQIPALGNQLGLFAKSGVRVDISNISGGAKVLAAVTGGSLDCGAFGAPVPENAVLHGAHLEWNAIWLPTAPTVIVARQGINSLADLKGKTVGVANPGTLSAILTNRALTDAGVSHDVTARPLGDQGTVLNAFVAGQIDAAMFTTPLSFTAIQKSPGAHIIHDFSKSGLVWPGAGIACSSDFTKSHADTMKAFMRGLVAAVQAFKNQPDAAKKAIADGTHTKDEDAVQKSYDLVAPQLRLNPIPQPSDETTVLKELAATNPAAGKLQPSQVQDDTYIRAVLPK